MPPTLPCFETVYFHEGGLGLMGGLAVCGMQGNK